MTSAALPDFDHRATHYDKHATVQREAAAWLAEWLPEKIDGPALELGAGTGLFTRHLIDRSGRVIASDASPHMVQTGAATLPGATWAVAQASEPPADCAYRWIFSSSLAQWLPDPAATFRAWHRIAAPGARLISGWFVEGTLAEFLATCPEASPFAWRNTETWLRLLAESGWPAVRHESRRFSRRHPDSIAMLRAIHHVGAVIPRRFGPGRLRRAIRHHDQTHGSEQGIETSFVFLRVEALRA